MSVILYSFISKVNHFILFACVLCAPFVTLIAAVITLIVLVRVDGVVGSLMSATFPTAKFESQFMISTRRVNYTNKNANININEARSLMPGKPLKLSDKT